MLTRALALGDAYVFRICIAYKAFEPDGDLCTIDYGLPLASLSTTFEPFAMLSETAGSCFTR